MSPYRSIDHISGSAYQMISGPKSSLFFLPTFLSQISPGFPSRQRKKVSPLTNWIASQNADCVHGAQDHMFIVTKSCTRLR